ncbi:MAG: S8 family serine peptidase [Phycisphaerae bacterium]
MTLFVVLVFFIGAALGEESVIGEQEAKAIARANGWLIRQETRTGVIELAAIVNGVPWYNTTTNLVAADTIATDECRPGGSSGYGLTGSGVTLGVWDAAGVRLTHQEFGGRAVQRDAPTGTHWHATHVAGTMVASGVIAAATGMSPSAFLDCYDWSNDITEMRAAAAAGLRVSNHSYGFVTGWYFDSVNWWWYGDRNVSNNEDNRFGLYTGYSWSLDVAAYDYPYYLICRSAGNDRGEDGPPAGSPAHFHMVTPLNVEWETGADAHDPDGDHDSVTTRNVAKNVLTVGAVEDLPGGYAGPSSVVMTSFSSWGPSDDGRIKPDIVGNGRNLYSTDDTSDAGYRTLSGTSMATPSVAGSLGVLIEHWRATHPTEDDMRSSTLKGLVLHTAEEAGSADGPDYTYGWGLMNTLKAANTISADVANPLAISEWLINDGDTLELLITADGVSSELRATICWTDPPGTPPASTSLNPTTKMLVNDLDLRIERVSPLTSYLPWVLDGANPSAAATNADNTTDNVEQVIVTAPVTGVDAYALRITHKGSLSGGSQWVSVIISGASLISLSGASSNFMTVNVELEGITAPTTRNVTFVLTECATPDVQSVAVSMDFDATGFGSTALAVANTNAQWISAVEGHVLRGLLPLGPPLPASVAFTGADKLLAGDLTGDNVIDIEDFSVLGSRWNLAGTTADVNGDGQQNSADFLLLRAKAMQMGDSADACP